MKTIAFFNNEGGVGKTSLVYHLSHMYAEMGVQTLAVDLDPQANLTAMFVDEDRLGPGAHACARPDTRRARRARASTRRTTKASTRSSGPRGCSGRGIRGDAAVDQCSAAAAPLRALAFLIARASSARSSLACTESRRSPISSVPRGIALTVTDRAEDGRAHRIQRARERDP